MDTVVARNVAASQAEEATIVTGGLVGGTPLTSPQVSNLAQVAAAAETTFPSFLALRSPAGVTLTAGPFQPVLRDDANFGSSIDRPLMRVGHAPRADRPNDVMISESFARLLHVRVGNVLRVRAVSLKTYVAVQTGAVKVGSDYGFSQRLGPLIPLRVVGITAERLPSDVAPESELILSDGFARTYPANVVGRIGQLIRIRLRNGERDIASLETAITRLSKGQPQRFTSEFPTLDRTAHALRVEGTTLEVLALVIFLTGTLLLLQFTARLADEQRDFIEVARAVGLRRGLILGAVSGPGMTVAVIGVVCAIVVEALLTQKLEFGGAPALEPGRGLVIDPVVTLVGAGFALCGAAAASVIAARSRSERQQATASGSGAGGMLGRLGLRPFLAAGVRLAATPAPRRSRAVIWARFAALILGVAMVATGATLYRSVDHILATPSLYGQDYNVLGVTTLEGEAPIRKVADQPGVSGATALELQSAVVAGYSLGLAVFQPVKGAVGPQLLAGRAPRAANEVALGTATLRTLHTAIGRKITVDAGLRQQSMTIVGRVVLPYVQYATGTIDAANGIVVTPAGGRRLLGTVTFNRVLVQASPRERAQLLTDQAFSPPDWAPQRQDMTGFRSVAAWIVALFGVAVVILLAQAVAGIARRRELELALMRAFGFGPRQVQATVACAAGWLAVVALIGLPIGLAAGRLVWNVIAEREGVIAVSIIPWGAAGLLILGTLCLAGAASVLPGVLVSRRAAATRLRFGE